MLKDTWGTEGLESPTCIFLSPYISLGVHHIHATILFICKVLSETRCTTLKKIKMFSFVNLSKHQSHVLFSIRKLQWHKTHHMLGKQMYMPDLIYGKLTFYWCSVLSQWLILLAPRQCFYVFVKRSQYIPGKGTAI